MPVGEPGEASASMSVIWPAFPVQSTQVLPWLELKPSTGWLKMLYASKRNCALMRSVMGKFLATDKSEKNALGPKNVSIPAFPIAPQAGSAKCPEVGRAMVQVSCPIFAGLRLYASGATGTKSTHVPFTLRGPTLNPWPLTKSGRHGPVSSIKPHSPIEAVHGKPLLQLSVLVSCQPPTIKFTGRLTSPRNIFPLPTGNS